MKATPEQRLIDAAPLREDADAALRPKRLDDFVGQKQAKDNLAIFIGAAKARGEALDHVLFHGPPGLGKTTLAQIVANELGVSFRSTSGPVITRPGDLAALLTNLEAGDVLFIDEIHRLSPAVEEVLYPAMEDYRLDLMIGEGPAARSVKIDLPRFTLIGATTRSGLLAKPLLDRFGIPVRLDFYAMADLTKIILRGADKLSAVMAPDGAAEIARRARGTPRVAGRLLRRVRDVATVDGAPEIDARVADAALARLEIDDLGLDPLDRRYLRLIAEHFGGGPVGVAAMNHQSERRKGGNKSPRRRVAHVARRFRGVGRAKRRRVVQQGEMIGGLAMALAGGDFEIARRVQVILRHAVAFHPGDAEIERAVRVALGGGLREIIGGGDGAARKTGAFGVHDPKPHLRARIALRGGEAEPAGGALVIRIDAAAVKGEKPERDLRIGIAGDRRVAIVTQRRPDIGPDAEALFVKIAEKMMGGGVAFLFSAARLTRVRAAGVSEGLASAALLFALLAGSLLLRWIGAGRTGAGPGARRCF